jgi:hypothetical protein
VRLLAIDPGSLRSAWVLYDHVTGRPIEWAKARNDELLELLDGDLADRMAVEMIASYGMPVGADVFATCLWIGRFIERWLRASWVERSVPQLVYRRQVKLHLCGTPRAKDSNVRQALIDRYGPGREKAIGRKASPGPLYGMKADCWSALAVAVAACEEPTLELVA